MGAGPKTGPTTGPGTTTTAGEVEVRSDRFAPSPRGARTARRVAVRWMEEWGWAADSDTSCAVALVVGELAANAVRHGRVPGHECGLRLVLCATGGSHDAPRLIRVEVADPASARRPPVTVPSACLDGESGRGLLLVDILCLRWGWEPRQPLGKTVWAEVEAGSAGKSSEGVGSCGDRRG